jgi:acyl carrier protein
MLTSDIVRQSPTETTEAQVERLVREYSDSVPQGRPLTAQMSLRDDLAIESLSLVSLAVRLGTELGVDVADVGLELGDVKTLGDLVRVAETIQSQHQPTNEANDGREQ